jgi:hypothetical protein
VGGSSVVNAPAAKPKRRRGNALEQWEVSLVKAMLANQDRTDQDILAYFTRPTRSVNHRLIGQIRKGAVHAKTPVATDQDLASFLATWPEVDPQTGLSLRGDELLVKAREAMIAAVHTFNGAGLHFRAELFIVTAIIAWTYLHHAHFKRLGIDYRYVKNIDGQKQVVTTDSGAEKFWELSQCLRHAKCPLTKGMVGNLEFLIDLRNEIEHRSTSRIDDEIATQPLTDAVPVHANRRCGFDPRVARLHHPHSHPTQLGLGRPVLLTEVPYAHHQAIAHERGKGGSALTVFLVIGRSLPCENGLAHASVEIAPEPEDDFISNEVIRCLLG